MALAVPGVVAANGTFIAYVTSSILPPNKFTVKYSPSTRTALVQLNMFGVNINAVGIIPADPPFIFTAFVTLVLPVLNPIIIVCSNSLN